MKAKQFFISLTLGLSLTLALLWLLLGSPLPMVQAQSGTKVIPVAPTGNNVDNCGPRQNPCRTVQYAVDRASKDDEIRVAAGTYTGVQRRTAPAGYNGPRDIKQVVYINENITICGGYTTTNAFAGPPDPVANPTTLDAQGQGRVVFITGNIHPTIEGLHITSGDAAGLGGHTTPEGDTRDAGGGGVCHHRQGYHQQQPGFQKHRQLWQWAVSQEQASPRSAVTLSDTTRPKRAAVG